ncbi:hypothetical protein E2320_014040 [Naja naja]|nr:hypothetical protein E2320_014040 [Naja naja]
MQTGRSSSVSPTSYKNIPQFAHGGAIATILDSTVGASVISVSRRVVTANLSINYKSPVELGSVVLVDTRVFSSNCCPALCPRKKRIPAAPLKTDNLDAHRRSSSSAFLFLNSPTTNPSWSFIGISPPFFAQLGGTSSWKKLQNHKRHTFFESVGGEGKGFKYAMFKNPSEKRVMAVFQLGPYLEGPSGAIAAILDQTIVACIIFLKSKMMTANLNVKYKCPMALGSVIVVDTKVAKIKGRKVFTSSEIQNVDGQTLHKEIPAAPCNRQPGCPQTQLCVHLPLPQLSHYKLLSRQEPHQLLRDFGVPNPSWSQEMMDQFEKFTKMSEDGSWQRMPSYNNCVDSMPAHSKLGYKPRKHQDACLFVRNVATEGRGFEFAMFYNGSERRMVVLLQLGSYLEGMIGPIPLGSVVLVETKVEKVEEKKIFLSGCVQSTDAQNLHAEATALLIHLDEMTSSHPVTSSN